MKLTGIFASILLLLTFVGCKSLYKTSGVESEFLGVEQQWKPGDIVKVILAATNIQEVHYARVAFTGPAEIVPFQTMRKVDSNLEVIFEVPKRNRFDEALLAFEIFDNAGNRTILYPRPERFKAVGLDVPGFQLEDAAGDDTQYVEFDAPVITGMSYDETAPELISARLAEAESEIALFEYVVKDEGFVTAEVEVGIDQSLSGEVEARRVVARTNEGFLSMCSRTTVDLLNCRLKLPLPKILPRKPYVRLVLTDLQGHESIVDSSEEPQKFSIAWPTSPQIEETPMTISSVRVLEQTSEVLKLEISGGGGGGFAHVEMVVGSGIDLKTLQPRGLDCSGNRCLAEFALPVLKDLGQEPVADVRTYGANGASIVSDPIRGIDFQIAGNVQAPKIKRIRFERASKNELLSFF